MRALLDAPALLTGFRTIAHLEAVSWAGLLTGMALERGVPRYEALGDRLVFLFGSAHGGLVIAFLALGLGVGIARRWGPGTYALGFLATLPPFATLAFDAWAQRSGRYRRPTR
jgi:RND superfamily putative drug exporter